MQVIWAPWRMAYVGDRTERECIFCAAPRGDARARLLLGTTPASLVMLNRYPYQNGHLMVAPCRHTASLADLAPGEHADLAETLRRAIASLGSAFHPDGFNVGMNLGTVAGAGIADHLHWHVVPRWAGDTNFMPVIAETKVMPQHLLETYDRLRPAFDWLAVAA
ncbi:MAG TPA: HIT domain-containing protein [Candidatus Binatia bacterium]|jgi:ATP adenylyltransferase|nr:HIT domain-containing protein [Candidatus Binatia bacterium]